MKFGWYELKEIELRRLAPIKGIKMVEKELVVCALVAVIAGVSIFGMIKSLVVTLKETQRANAANNGPGAMANGSEWVVTLAPSFRYRFSVEICAFKIVGLGFPALGLLLWPLLHEIHVIAAISFLVCMGIFYYFCFKLAKDSEDVLAGLDKLGNRHLVVSSDGLEVCAAIFSDFRTVQSLFTRSPNNCKLNKSGELYVIPWDQVQSFTVGPRWYSAVYNLNLHNYAFAISLNRILLEPLEAELIENLKLHLGERLVIKK